MITHLTISNFQSLARVTLDLGTWTSIVGESDIGKSAVWRAIHAATTNRSGDSFIRHGEKMCEVTLDLADGTRIEWEKARGKSGTYHLDVPGQSVRVYEKTNGEVPAAVRALLNVSMDVAGEPLTPGLQSQHDKAFLLADTPRRRAQVLGEFDGSNIALAAETLLRTGQRTAQTTLRAAEQQAEAATATLAAYEGLPAALDALAASERIDEDVTARTARVERLRGLSQGVRVALARAEGHAASAARLTLPTGLPTVEAIGQAEERVRAGRQMVARARFCVAAAMTEERLGRAVRLPSTTGALLEMVAQGVQRTEALRVAVTGARYHVRQAEAAEALLAAAPPPSVGAVDALQAQGERLRALRVALGRWRDAFAGVLAAGMAAEDAGAAEHGARDALLALAGETCPECGQVLAGGA